jgi:Na+-translocating ferredoxin:NAD+ oxidoreductase RNF subunit RnfB
MSGITLSINGVKLTTVKGKSLLEAAREAGIYIPALCAYPGLTPAPGMRASTGIYRGRELVSGTHPGKEFEGCQLCRVEIAGEKEFPQACITPAEEGMVVRTETPQLQQLRRHYLAAILAEHPHVCLMCAQREGCSLTSCSFGVAEKERCCFKFNRCELRKVAEYIGIEPETPRYIFSSLPLLQEEPLFARDYNLCIGCLRCVRACQEIKKAGALSFVYQQGKVIVGRVAPSYKESGCQLCGACVEVCPTGALADIQKAKPGRREKLGLSPPVFPPEKCLPLDAIRVSQVPEVEGVLQLLDASREVVYIKGTPNLRQELEEQLRTQNPARYFLYEEAPLYTCRESELLQQFLQQHGRLPSQNDELEKLF